MRVSVGGEEKVAAGLLYSNNDTLLKEVRSLIDFERRLAKIMVPEADRPNASRLYNLR